MTPFATDDVANPADNLPSSEDLSVGKLARQSAELASCLRDAVDSLGILRQPGLQLNWLDALIERSKAALKEYDK